MHNGCLEALASASTQVRPLEERKYPSGRLSSAAKALSTTPLGMHNEYQTVWTTCQHKLGCLEKLILHEGLQVWAKAMRMTSLIAYNERLMTCASTSTQVSRSKKITSFRWVMKLHVVNNKISVKIGRILTSCSRTTPHATMSGRLSADISLKCFVGRRLARHAYALLPMYIFQNYS